jgi:hypothetical protein
LEFTIGPGEDGGTEPSSSERRRRGAEKLSVFLDFDVVTRGCASVVAGGEDVRREERSPRTPRRHDATRRCLFESPILSGRGDSWRCGCPVDREYEEKDEGGGAGRCVEGLFDGRCPLVDGLRRLIDEARRPLDA